MIHRFLLSAAAVLLIGLPAAAQTQLMNPGFEEWESIQHGSVPEPVQWSSARSAVPDELAQLAPAVWDRSEDAHSGDYSVYLINKEAFQIVATGTMTNGRVLADLDPTKGNVHTDKSDSRWNLAFTDRPDSVAGWYKASPQAGDFPTVKIVLHTDSASIPSADSATWVAIAAADLPSQEVTSWTRFSVPFQYLSDEQPEFLLAVLTAGDALNSKDGSEVWFDDIELIYNNTAVDEWTSDRLQVYYADGYLNLFADYHPSTAGQLIITDVSGKKLMSGVFRTGDRQVLAMNLKPGIYLVSLVVGDKRLAKKLIVN